MQHLSSPRSRLRGARVAALAAAVAALGASREAAATGMQGHIYMAQCAAEMTGDPRLVALFAAHPQRLANGAFFPDSGYTAEDHDQGEIAHWEQYVEGYIQIIRGHWPAHVDDAEGAPHVAVLMGLAAHGITDSTFDSLLMARAYQVEPGDMNSFDTAMDTFLVNDMPRYFIPELAYDAQAFSDVYTLEIPHAVTPKAIDDAMSKAQSGIAVVAKFLYLEASEYGDDFPWARPRILDPRAPGGYAFGARVVSGYYREILRRLDGDTTADQVVIGTYPDASYPLITLDNTRPDGRLVIFFGEGIDRSTIDDGTVVVHDGVGNVIPTKVEVFRGDTWANVITVEAQTPWLPSTSYTATLSNTIKTLSGASPASELELSFTTCTPPSPGADCAELTGAPPPSPCPMTEAKYAERPGAVPEDPPPEDPPKEEPPKEKPPSKIELSGGCALGANGASGELSLAAIALACAALRGRRRARRGSSRR